MLSKRGFAVAWISFSFPEFQFYFLKCRKPQKAKGLAFCRLFLEIQLISRANSSNFIGLRWVSKLSVDTCFLASYFCKSIGRVLGLRWPGMHLSVDRRRDWSSKWADVRSHPLFWWAVKTRCFCIEKSWWASVPVLESGIQFTKDTI